MRMTGIYQRSELYLFRVIVRSKYGEKLRASGRITNSTLRELFKKKLVELGHSPDRFGLHSLRESHRYGLASVMVCQCPKCSMLFRFATSEITSYRRTNHYSVNIGVTLGQIAIGGEQII